MDINPVAIDGFSFAMLTLVIFFVVRNAKNEILEEIRKGKKDKDSRLG